LPPYQNSRYVGLQRIVFTDVLSQVCARRRWGGKDEKGRET
jgi:hypothetical protein